MKFQDQRSKFDFINHGFVNLNPCGHIFVFFKLFLHIPSPIQYYQNTIGLLWLLFQLYIHLYYPDMKFKAQISKFDFNNHDYLNLTPGGTFLLVFSLFLHIHSPKRYFQNTIGPFLDIAPVIYPYILPTNEISDPQKQICLY